MIFKLKLLYRFNNYIINNFFTTRFYQSYFKNMENQQQNQQQNTLHQKIQNQPKQNSLDQRQKIENYTSRENNKTYKVKCGIFFGYNGQKYLGMQYQRATQNTVQNVLHKILVDHGFILKTNQDQLRRIAWSRAARTDKRVHALCNGISLKLQISDKFTLQNSQKQVDFDKVRNFFNSQLPRDINIFAVKKVAKGFDMRHDALTRVYNYIIPIYVFQKAQEFEKGKVPSLQQETQILQKLNKLCKLYLGTHSYHNFTKGYKPNDPRTQRYMISMKAQSVENEVFNRYWIQHKEQEEQKRNINSQRFIRFTLIGQSFIYHQIRKMIGLLIKIYFHQLQGQQTIKQAFAPGKYHPFLAPGQGLYLNRMTFQTYNRRKLSNNQKTVQLTQQQQQRVLKFRQYLQSQILYHEIEQKVFTKWLNDRIQHKDSQQDEQRESQQQEQIQDEIQGKQEGEDDKQKKNGCLDEQNTGKGQVKKKEDYKNKKNWNRKHQWHKKK